MVKPMEHIVRMNSRGRYILKMIVVPKDIDFILMMTVCAIIVSGCTHTSSSLLSAPIYELAPSPSSYVLPYPPNGAAQLLPEASSEMYGRLVEQSFKNPSEQPLSTFSIDVDTAAYANMRRFIRDGQLPPKDAIRIEEYINYFDYGWPPPKDGEPLTIYTELGICPWNTAHHLLMISWQGQRIEPEHLPPANLVFLLDVSGSMADDLAMIKTAMRLLVDTLRPQDRVSIVVYAGAAGLVLPPTRGNHKSDIHQALEKLQAGGSTAGEQGIELAYEQAQKHFDPKANNRIILVTDGDFNVGVREVAALTRLVEKKRQTGVYAYLDSLLEAKKVLIREMGGTLLTIAKDVKLQVEFNPAKVKAYRLKWRCLCCNCPTENDSACSRSSNTMWRRRWTVTSAISRPVFYSIFSCEKLARRSTTGPLRTPARCSRNNWRTSTTGSTS